MQAYGRLPAHDYIHRIDFLPLSNMLNRAGYSFNAEQSCECSKPKPTENDKTKKALKEIEYATEKAKAILSAADALTNKRIDNVEVNGNSLYISFSKVDDKAEKANAEKVQDTSTHYAMNATRENLATELSGLLQKAGRTMLTLTAMAAGKLVAPELQQIKAAQDAKMAGNNQGGNASNEKIASLQVKENIAKAAHASDCATNNAPAMKPGDCDCK